MYKDPLRDEEYQIECEQLNANKSDFSRTATSMPTAVDARRHFRTSGATRPTNAKNKCTFSVADAALPLFIFIYSDCVCMLEPSR